jgi:hypothetical protein
MTLLLDFLPIILFFGTFKFAGAQKEWATNFANQHFGFLVSGGVVGPDEAPVLLATLVVIAAMVVQVGVTLARGKKVDKIVWLSFAIIPSLRATQSQRLRNLSVDTSRANSRARCAQGSRSSQVLPSILFAPFATSLSRAMTREVI